MNALADLGEDWADYVIALADNMNHLYSVGQESNNVAELWYFEVAQSIRGLESGRRVSRHSVNAALPVPGLPLSFSRRYAQPIASRYELLVP